MITKMKPLVSAIAIGALVLIQGCGQGDSHTEEFENAGTANLVSAALGGSAVKGLLAGADCIVNDTTGVIYTTVGRSSACTDSQGNYSIYLRKVPKWPLMVTIKARAGSTMKCDLPAGCGSTPFGGQVSVPTDFSMRAMAPTPPGRSLSVNVTPWSEMATARALNANNGALDSNVSDTAVNSANGQVAGLLNNLLGLEGQVGAFDNKFFSTLPADLSNPKSSDDSKGLMMTMLSAALIAYQNDSTSLTKVINNLADSFKADGKLNVNDHASNIESTDANNLTDLLKKLSQVTSQLSGVLTANQLATLQAGLASGTTATTLDKLKTNVDALTTAKDAVTDANQDPTAPIPVVAITDPVRAAKAYVAEVASVFNAIDAANGATSPVQIYETALSASSSAVDDATRALLRAAEASAQIARLTSNEATDLGCSGSVATALTCDFGALTELTEATAAGAGTVSWNATTKVIATSGITIDGVAISLGMTQSSATSTTTTQQMNFDAETLMASAGGIVADASGATFEFQKNPSSKGNWSVYSSDLYDSEASITAASVDFAGILNISRSTPDTADGGGFGLSHIYMDGEFSKTGVSNLKAAISFDVNSSTAAEGTLPTDQSGDSFYVVTDLRISLTTPVTSTKYNLTTLQPESSETVDTLVMDIAGDRTAYQAGTIASFGARLMGSQMLAAGTGSFDFSSSAGIKKLTLRKANGVKVEFSADSNNDVTATISVTNNGVTSNAGSISKLGTATFSDGTAVSIAAFLFKDKN